MGEGQESSTNAHYHLLCQKQYFFVFCAQHYCVQAEINWRQTHTHDFRIYVKLFRQPSFTFQQLLRRWTLLTGLIGPKLRCAG